jgi:hypothetical protein
MWLEKNHGGNNGSPSSLFQVNVCKYGFTQAPWSESGRVDSVDLFESPPLSGLLLSVRALFDTG